MIPGVVFHPREEWVDPKYPVFGPFDNPNDNDTVVIHYTAADDLIDGDPGEYASDLPAYMRAMNRSYWVTRGYALGYLFAVDWLGGVWQVRGWEYQSAANQGHNGHTWPILLLVDGNDMATAQAAASVRAIVAECEFRSGRKVSIVGHGQLPGAATSCPGVGLRTQIAAGVFVPNPKLPPIDNDEDDMAYLAVPPPERKGSPWLYVSSSVRPATSFDVSDGVEQRKMESIPKAYRVEQYDALHRAAGLS